MTFRPNSRVNDLTIEELHGGLVVYDTLTNQAHWLDPSTTIVWRASDGTRTVEEVGFAAETDRGAVIDALARLEEIGLLEPSPEEHDEGISRRTVLRRTAAIGAAAAAAAPIMSMAIPAAAAASSAGCPPCGPVPCCPPQQCVPNPSPGGPAMCV